ncbi:MAG: hypothetical protein J0I75_12610 [Hyphomicrobium sp.]|nr:hypothetical protein [Hyphomicrobium sp.]
MSGRFCQIDLRQELKRKLAHDMPRDPVEVLLHLFGLLLGVRRDRPQRPRRPLGQIRRAAEARRATCVGRPLVRCDPELRNESVEQGFHLGIRHRPIRLVDGNLPDDRARVVDILEHGHCPLAGGRRWTTALRA